MASPNEGSSKIAFQLRSISQLLISGLLMTRKSTGRKLCIDYFMFKTTKEMGLTSPHLHRDTERGMGIQVNLIGGRQQV
jgi:hypothetical protein